MPGCIGDPYRGCVCEPALVDLCKKKLCGIGAQCRIVHGKETQCFCPADAPAGDPTIECKIDDINEKFYVILIINNRYCRGAERH